ncbi:hypothetical protein CYMTET_4816 [Cymbomonas tetramitiformis]|uniref:Uncharacterized protein n=1 Tax=Cymbomonas tetramitiformis TaxID=36881 RepID=A0AAE0H0G3_9CHLO|nr:hypothetical protein CYMTET_4816 [Cymbomonas tetramitiformis]
MKSDLTSSSSNVDFVRAALSAALKSAMASYGSTFAITRTPSMSDVPWNGASECSNLRANSSRTRFLSDGKAEFELSIQAAVGRGRHGMNEELKRGKKEVVCLHAGGQGGVVQRQEGGETVVLGDEGRP